MEVMVCVGSSCHLKGAENVIKLFQELIQQERVSRQVVLKGSFCLNKCSDAGVTVKIGEEYLKTTPEGAARFFYDTIMPRLEP